LRLKEVWLNRNRTHSNKDDQSLVPVSYHRS